MRAEQQLGVAAVADAGDRPTLRGRAREQAGEFLAVTRVVEAPARVGQTKSCVRRQVQAQRGVASGLGERNTEPSAAICGEAEPKADGTRSLRTAHRSPQLPGQVIGRSAG